MIVSQRDPKWSAIKLGTSDVTIGGYGCTITALGFLVGLTPDKVNERMNAVGGYANGNLVIWTKIQEAIGVTCYRYYGWDNQKVLDAISANGAVLGEVDGAAIGGTGKHWVVLTGDKKVQDPWTGAERPTSDFNFTGYTTVVFDKSKMGNYVSDNIYRDYDLTNKESMKVCVDQQVKVVEGQLVPVGDLNAEKEKVSLYKGKFEEVTKQNDELNTQLGTVRGELAGAMAKIDSQNKIISSYVNEDAVQLESFKTTQREKEEYREFIEDSLSQLEEDLKITISSNDTKESRLATIIATATSGSELETKYQSKILALETVNKKLVALKKPLAKISFKVLVSELLARMSGKKV